MQFRKIRVAVGEVPDRVLGLVVFDEESRSWACLPEAGFPLQMSSYVSDHPTSVSAINIARAPRLTSESVFPLPSSKLRVSALQQSTVATIKMAPQEIAHGNPGYKASVAIVFSEGCPAGIHHGRIGANPAASTNVKIFRLTQLLILVTGFALRTWRHT